MGLGRVLDVCVSGSGQVRLAKRSGLSPSFPGFWVIVTRFLLQVGVQVQFFRVRLGSSSKNRVFLPGFWFSGLGNPSLAMTMIKLL